MEPAPTKETPGPDANRTRTSLHQEVHLKAGARRIYEVLLSSARFTAFTGLPATVDTKAGAAFSLFKGMIVGRNVELVPDVRIVQAWRPTHWDAGVYSLVRFELKAEGVDTLLVLDHTSFPQGDFESLDAGWRAHYWEPLAQYLAKPASP